MTTDKDLNLEDALQKDRQLSEEQIQRGTELIALRWYWTLNTANPNRISVEEYARLVDRDFTGVHGQVLGYESWLEDGGKSSPTHLFEHWKKAENELRGKGVSLMETRNAMEITLRFEDSKDAQIFLEKLQDNHELGVIPEEELDKTQAVDNLERTKQGRRPVLALGPVAIVDSREVPGDPDHPYWAEKEANPLQRNY